LTARNALHTASQAPGVVVADLNTGIHANLNALLAAADERISALQNYSANHNTAQIKVDALLNAMQGTDYNAILAARNALLTASQAPGVVVADLNTGIHANLNALLAAADERISALQNYSANHNLAQVKVDALLNAMQSTHYIVILTARNALQTALQAPGVVVADLNTGIHADLNALLVAADERIAYLQQGPVADIQFPSVTAIQSVPQFHEILLTNISKMSTQSAQIEGRLRAHGTPLANTLADIQVQKQTRLNTSAGHCARHVAMALSTYHNHVRIALRTASTLAGFSDNEYAIFNTKLDAFLNSIRVLQRDMLAGHQVAANVRSISETLDGLAHTGGPNIPRPANINDIPATIQILHEHLLSNPILTEQFGTPLATDILQQFEDHAQFGAFMNDVHSLGGDTIIPMTQSTEQRLSRFAEIATQRKAAGITA